VHVSEVKEASAASWAFEEFGHAAVPDRRWGRRLVRMAAQGARRPAGRVTEVFGDAAERQGAYGLLESTEVAAADVAAAMFKTTARRSRGQPFVYCPVDGTSLTLTDRNRAKDFGSVGSHGQGARGIKVMNTMVLSARGVPLGVSAQQWWTRPHHRRAKHRDNLQPLEKETGRWLQAIAGTRQVMAEHAPGTVCWFQMDREADAWPILFEAGLDKHWFSVRACRRRRVVLPSGRRGRLHAVLGQQPPVARYELPIRAAAKRSARTATVEIRACSVTLDLRNKQTRRRFPLTLNVVQVLERGTTPRGEKPVEWTLLTNRPIQCTQDLFDVVFGYSLRWRIEELHRTWKSGGCRVEETQLRSSAAVIKWATILTAVAARIERIKQLSRQEPLRPATDEFSPVEIRAAALLRFGKAGKSRLRASVPTMAEITAWIAEIGGYTGPKSSGGPPGSITIARGLKDVRAAAKALAAAAEL
jgi:hypothetical protein